MHTMLKEIQSQKDTEVTSSSYKQLLLSHLLLCITVEQRYKLPAEESAKIIASGNQGCMRRTGYFRIPIDNQCLCKLCSVH